MFLPDIKSRQIFVMEYGRMEVPAENHDTRGNCLEHYDYDATCKIDKYTKWNLPTKAAQTSLASKYTLTQSGGQIGPMCADRCDRALRGPDDKWSLITERGTTGQIGAPGLSQNAGQPLLNFPFAWSARNFNNGAKIAAESQRQCSQCMPGIPNPGTVALFKCTK